MSGKPTNTLTNELREYARQIATVNATTSDLLAIADRIDAEHKTRMSQSRRESRRAVLRYLRSVLCDYEKGVKRVRKCDKTEVVRCRDCMYARRMDDRFVCTVRPLLAHLVDADEYCSRGERREESGELMGYDIDQVTFDEMEVTGEQD